MAEAALADVHLTEAEAVLLIDARSADPARRLELAALLREDHPIYDQRSAAVAARLRGWVLIAVAHGVVTDRELLFILEELESGLDPYTIAAAAYALRSYPAPAARFAPFVVQALQNVAGHDEPLSLDDYDDYGTSESATTAVAELLRTAAWLGPVAHGILPDLQALRNQPGFFSRDAVALCDRALARFADPTTPASADPATDACCDWPDALRGVFAWRRDRSERARITDEVQLEDHDGRSGSYSDVFHGTPWIVTFFYTRCDNPLKCSLTISKVSRVQSLLAARGLTGRIRVAAITYDPGFDSPERLRRFAAQRGLRLDADHRMLRATAGMDAVRRQFGLGVNFFESIVNRHRIEAFVLDARGRIVCSFERLRWDEAEIVDRAADALNEDGLQEADMHAPAKAGGHVPASAKAEAHVLTKRGASAKAEAHVLRDNPAKAGSHVRKAGRSASAVVPALALALLPKCPVCWAAYVSAFGVAGLERTATLARVEPLLIAAIAVNVGATWFRGRLSGRTHGAWITTLGATAFVAAWLGGPDLRVAGVAASVAGAALTDARDAAGPRHSRRRARGFGGEGFVTRGVFPRLLSPRALQSARVPIDYSIDHDKRRVTCVWLPPVEAVDVIAVIERAVADGAWTYGMLHDARAVSAEAASTQPVQDLVNQLRADHGERGPVAIIANPEQVGRAEAYAIRGDREGHAVQVFWDRQDADAWLVKHTRPTAP